MKYITMQQKMLAVFMAIMLSGSIQAAKPHIDDASAEKLIERHLRCDQSFAKQVKDLMVKADGIIFEFLDYNGNKQAWNDHIAKFNAIIHEITVLEQTAKKNPKLKHAAPSLHNIHNSLSNILHGVQKVRKGEMGLTTLGLTVLWPVFNKLENELPTSLTIKSKIENKYGQADFLKHVDERLKMA